MQLPIYIYTYMYMYMYKHGMIECSDGNANFPYQMMSSCFCGSRYHWDLCVLVLGLSIFRPVHTSTLNIAHQFALMHICCVHTMRKLK